MRSARRARRRFHPGGALDGVAEGRGVGEAGIAGNALRQPHAVRRRAGVSNNFSIPLCDVEHPQLQIEHRLARHAEQEVARLNDAGVDGADRHLEHPFAFDLAELVPRAA